MVELKLDLKSFLKRLNTLTKKTWLSSSDMGEYSSVFRGSGKEFEGFSDYSPDQDSRNIDWTASAKSNKLMIRTHVDERNMDCIVVLDVSSNMFYTSTDKLKCEYAAEIANELLYASLATGNKVGALLSSSKKQTFVTPSNAKVQYARILEELSNGDNYGGERDILKSLGTLFKSKMKGVLFIISDLLNAKSEELEAIRILSQKFQIYILLIRDQYEYELPKNVRSLVVESLANNKSIIIDIPNIKDEYKAEMKLDLERLRKFFLQHDIHFTEFHTQFSYQETLSKLLRSNRV